MDPDAALSDVFDAVADREPERAAELAENLLFWIDRGGFVPGGGRLRTASLIRFLRNFFPEEEPDVDEEYRLFQFEYPKGDRPCLRLTKR